MMFHAHLSGPHGTVSIIQAYRNYALTCATSATKWQLQRNNPVLITALPFADLIKEDAIPIMNFVKIVE